MAGVSLSWDEVFSVRVFFVSLSLICLSALWLRKRSQTRRYPKGPWGFPILGHVPLLGKNPPATLERYRKQYGDIFSLRFGSYPVVVLNRIDTIKTALTRRPDDFGERPLLYSFKLISDMKNGNVGLGIPFGPKWKVLRKITNNALRMFANYRTNPVEEILHEEGNRLVDYFLSHGKIGFNPKDEMGMSVGSVIYQILFGRSANIREDKNYCNMIKSNKDFTEFVGAGNPPDIMPWTRFFFRNRIKRFIRLVDFPYNVLKTQSEEHEQTFDYNNTRDIMDALLNASEDLSREERESMDISKDLIMSVTVGLLGAGVDTIVSTLLWTVFLMVKYPDVQRRVHDEIDENIGNSRRPTMGDKKNLIYVEATLLEVMRFSSVAPLSVPRQTTVDSEIGDYIIPKGTFVLVNQYSTCMDVQVWGDPQNFRPDRFLKTDSNGDVSIDANLAESFMVFGAGRRRCIGEFLAKVEVFLFFTIMMQRCSFLKCPSEKYSMETEFGLSIKPKDYKIIVTERP